MFFAESMGVKTSDSKSFKTKTTTEEWHKCSWRIDDETGDGVVSLSSAAAKEFGVLPPSRTTVSRDTTDSAVVSTINPHSLPKKPAPAVQRPTLPAGDAAADATGLLGPSLVCPLEPRVLICSLVSELVSCVSS